MVSVSPTQASPSTFDPSHVIERYQRPTWLVFLLSGMKRAFKWTGISLAAWIFLWIVAIPLPFHTELGIVDYVIIALFFMLALGVVFAPARYRAIFGCLMLAISLGLIAVYLQAELSYPHGPSVVFEQGYTIDHVRFAEDTDLLDIPTWVKAVRRTKNLILLGAIISAVGGVGRLLGDRRIKYLHK